MLEVEAREEVVVVGGVVDAAEEEMEARSDELGVADERLLASFDELEAILVVAVDGLMVISELLDEALAMDDEELVAAIGLDALLRMLLEEAIEGRSDELTELEDDVTELLAPLEVEGPDMPVKDD